MKKTIFKNANIIPISQDGILEGYDIHTDSAIIIKVIPTTNEDQGEVDIIDCTGKYIIPGLVDSHMHIVENSYLTDLKLNVAFGVTSIRNMWGNQSMTDKEVDTFKLKCDIEGGQIMGPTLVNTSRVFDGTSNIQPSSRMVKTKAAAKLFFDQALSEKADQIKIYNSIQPDVLECFYELANEKGIKLVGHKPLDCEDEVFFKYSHSVEHTVTFDDSKMDALIKSECYFIPTMMIEHQVGVTTGEKPFDFFEKYKDYTKYDNPNTVAMMEGLRLSAVKDPVLYRSYFAPYVFEDERMMQKVEKYVSSGKIPGAGTDGNPYSCTGVGLHSELSFMSKTSMTNQQILYAGTLQGARILEIEERKGSIEVGKEADMVILNSNPLVCIDHTLDIHAVVLRGTHLDRLALDKILEEVLVDNEKVRNELATNQTGIDITTLFSGAKE